MLRHYDSLGLLSPSGRTPGGYREYTGADFRRLFQIESLRSLGLGLDEVRTTLETPDFSPARLIEQVVARTQRRLADDQELLDRLGRVRAAEPVDWPDVLRIVGLLREWNSPHAAIRQQAVLSAETGRAVATPTLVASVLRERDENVAGALRWALADRGEDALPELEEALEAADAPVRERALRAVAEISGQRATRSLLPLLDDPEPGIRRRAAVVLGRRGREEAEPTLIEMVVDGVGDVDASEALGVLAENLEMAGPLVRRLAVLLAAPGSERRLRLRLLQTLAEIPDDLATEELSRAAEDEDRTVAAVAETMLRDRAPDC